MQRLHSQRGFSIVTAIFVLVMLAGLAAGMVSFSTAQNQTTVQDVLGARAYQAANAGIEWAAYTIQTNPGVAGATNFVPGSTTALGGQLAGFTVAVSYTASSLNEGTDVLGNPVAVWSYDIVSTATYGTVGKPDYVERVLHAKM